jgi:flagellar basal body-associated protein FliL
MNIYDIEHFGIKSYPIGHKCKKNRDCASSYCDRRKKKCSISKGGKIALLVTAVVLTAGVGGPVVALAAAGAGAGIGVEMEKSDRKKDKKQDKKQDRIKKERLINATTSPPSIDNTGNTDDEYVSDEETGNSFIGNLFNFGNNDEPETDNGEEEEEDEEETDEKTDEEDKKFPIYGIVLIIIAVIIVSGVILYFLFRKKKVVIKYSKPYIKSS